MPDSYDQILRDSLEAINTKSLRVDLSGLKIFVCGGPIDGTALIPPSFRDRFVSFVDREANYQEVYDRSVFAENFKDYFRDNAFTDLVVFEEEIANLSALIIIFLESPGSLVELGMFCNKLDYRRKLHVVVPQDKVEAEDSFIFLGPLEYIKKENSDSVEIYPWPDSAIEVYSQTHLIALCESVLSRLNDLDDTADFKSKNSGHVALLIVDIVSIYFPIMQGEILAALKYLGVDIEVSELKRHIYLLEQLGFLSHYQYSRHDYYYSPTERVKPADLGHVLGLDGGKLKLQLRMFLEEKDTPSNRKRLAALEEIQKIVGRGRNEPN